MDFMGKVGRTKCLCIEPFLQVTICKEGKGITSTKDIQKKECNSMSTKRELS